MTVQDLGDSPPEEQGFLERLSLQRIDKDIFMGWCHAGAPLRAFGGQVAAQALVAAGRTVDQPDRSVHSLHAYFLRGGSTTDHIVYMVDRIREGRSFSTRRVQAVQYGKTIFAMSASYAGPLLGPEHTAENTEWIRGVPKPDTLQRENVTERRRRQNQEGGYPQQDFVDFRYVPEPSVRNLAGGRFHRMAWVRADQTLPDEEIYHVCAMTYFSDLTLVATVMGHHGGYDAHPELEVASIDHAMWFHNRFRGDEWLLFATSSPLSGRGHGFATGQFYTSDGTLVCSTAQEVLMREPLAE